MKIKVKQIISVESDKPYILTEYMTFTTRSLYDAITTGGSGETHHFIFTGWRTL